MTRFAAPLAVLLTVGLGALSTTGCELIAQVDRSKIIEPTGAGGAGGTAPAGPTGSGGMMGTGGAGGTGGMVSSCTVPDDCPGTDTACQTRTCDNGFCGVDYVPAGTATQTQIVGDCQMEICDGNGNITLANDDQDILDDQNPCTDDLCSAGSPVNTPSPAGTACSQGTGTMCDGNGACIECLFPSDCTSGVCQMNACIAATCTDGVKNDTETDIDCGGPACSPCADGLVCGAPTDCTSGVCTGNLCQVPTCIDTTENGAETDVDCGGGTCNPCSSGQGCAMDSDCVSQLCSGSLCLATCTDGEKNSNETDIDCGGPTCNACNDGQTCAVNGDCASGVCSAGVCQVASCSDTVKNGTETDVDCGGGCPPCGPNQVCTLPSECTSGICNNGLCTTPICGDGVTNGAETCDDGATMPGDGCDATCASEPGYSCTGTPSVCVIVCGDGVLAAGEACDDGGTTPGDGCDANCTIESGYACTGAPSVCTGVCGDGIIVGAETCDDGGSAAGDGCDASCAIESGYACSGTPSSCAPICGDGVVVGGEQCDDSNTTAGDCCSSACTVEAGCEMEPNDTVALANDFDTLAVGGQMKASIKPIGDTDYFSFTTTQIVDVRVETFDGTGAPNCASGHDAEVWLYASDGTTQLATDDDDGPGLCADLNATNDPGARRLLPGTYFLRVEHATGGSTINNYILRISYTAVCGNGVTEGSEQCDGSANCNPDCTVLSVCGDGTKEGIEQCDDGNTAAGDGCSSTCTLEVAAETEPNGTCAEANGPIALSAGMPTRLASGSVTPAGDLDWFAFTIPTYADVRFETFDKNGPGTCASIDTVIQAFKPDCTQLGSSKDQGGILNCSKIDPSVDTYVRHLAPGTYYLQVKAWSSTATFDYTLQATMTAICGNGVTEGSEECDGGANCNPDCTIIPVCGNGTKEGSEECDDGNTTAGDTCSPTCTWEDTAETEPNGTCAEANGPIALTTSVPTQLASGSVTPAGDLDWFAFTIPTYADVRFETFDSNGPGSCSGIDTVIQAFKPDCTQLGSSKDQGGISNCSKIDPSGDTYVRHLAPGTYYLQVKAWSSTATFDYTLQATMTAICGNGIPEGSEECDGGANCGADCILIPVCGDGVVKGMEQCDDGNTTSGDGCSATCAWESTAEVEPNNTTAEADAAGLLIDSSKNITAAVNPDGDIDIFKVQVATAQVVRFEVFDPSGIDCVGMSTMTLRLLDSMGAELKKDNPDTTASGISVCPALVVHLDPGTYYLESKKSTAGTIAGYFLQAKFQTDLGSEAEPNDTQAAANTIAGRDLFVYGDHQLETDLDWYAITVPQGASIRVETIEGDASETCESNGIDTTVTLYNAGGTSLGSDGDDGRGWCSTIDGTGSTPRDSFAHNLAAGTYYLQVESYNTDVDPDNQFNYRLVVTVR